MNTELVRIWGSSETIAETESIVDQPPEETTDYISLELGLWKSLYLAQTPSSQDFLEGEACKLTEALVLNKPEVVFSLPECINVPMSNSTTQESRAIYIPTALKRQKVGGLLKRLARKSLLDILKQRLDELESNIDPSVVVSAGLIRYTAALHLVHTMLPNGNQVVYLTIPGDEIPTIPVINDGRSSFSTKIPSTGILEVDPELSPNSNFNSQGVFASEANRFFLPQWVSFDGQNRLLANSFHDAEISLVSMKRYLHILNLAITLAPYLIADPECEEKRYGILGQIVNQGSAMARYEIEEIIQVIKERVRANNLNRGLSLSVTYFNDLSLELENRKIRVIPTGRILFHPAFIVLAVRKERMKNSQDLNMNYSTRKHFQTKLLDLERAFKTTKNHNEQ